MTETPNEVTTSYSDDYGDTPVKNVQLAFIINVSNVETLGQAIDKGAAALMRDGMDSFYIVATDTDTSDDYLVIQKQIMPASPELMEEVLDFLQTGRLDDNDDEDGDDTDEVDTDEPSD